MKIKVCDEKCFECIYDDCIIGNGRDLPTEIERREKRAEYMREWKRKNKEHLQEYRKKNAEKIREYQREYHREWYKRKKAAMP